MLRFSIPTKDKRFDVGEVDGKSLEARLEDLISEAKADFTNVGWLRLGDNSYCLEACKWLAENLIKKCTELRGLDVSNMFVARNNDVVPEALKVMLNAAIGHTKIRELRCSHNAIGLQAIDSLAGFLEQAEALELIDISNCGLSAEASQILAKTLDKCDKMRLKEFVAIRQQIRDTGIMALAETFGK